MNKKTKLYRFFNENGFEFIFGLIIVITYFTILLLINKQKALYNSINTILNFFITLVISMLFAMICGYFKNVILRNIEDKTRLTTDYKSLLERYYNIDNKLVKYGNEVFPVIIDADLKDKTIHFHYNCNSEYILPEVVLKYEKELLAAYHMKRWDNTSLFRVKDWKSDGNIFEVELENTNYYNTLLTNRTMDFPLNDNTTIRDRIDYFPKFPDLKDSLLSNHLGINGFVISKDGYVSFVHRSSSNTAGKNTLGNGISAKVNYKEIMKNDTDILNIAFLKSIADEIEKELRIKDLDINNIKIINAFRNVVEGGKPHFLFVYELPKKIKCEPHCNKICRKEHEKGKKFISSGRVICKDNNIRDGNVIEWIKLDLLSKAKITPDIMICDNKKYHLEPSAAACIVMLLNYLK